MIPAGGADDGALARRASDGDSEAFAELSAGTKDASIRSRSA